MKYALYGLAMLAMLSLVPAQAANREISALFQPDSGQPNKNVFINKTPNSGYCAEHPGECADNGMFSIRFPNRFRPTRSMQAGDAVAIKMPASWRQVTVVNADTGETEVVEIRISGIGSQYRLSNPAAELTGASSDREGHQKLWTTSSWNYAPAPCQYSGMGYYWPDTYTFFWKTPIQAACTKVAAYYIPYLFMDWLDVAYELRTPNPLGMSSGRYTGSLAFSVGPGGDFDLGPALAVDDSSVTFDFRLDVQHTLKVDLPPGGNKVALEPVGGWQSWIGEGRKPTRIFRDQLFYLSASAPFKVLLRCDSFGGPECKLFGKDNLTWVHTKLSLPAGVTGPDGSPVNDLLLTSHQWAGPFKPSLYQDRKPGSLRFELPPDAIDYVLPRPDINDTFVGNITVIWDSEV